MLHKHIYTLHRTVYTVMHLICAALHIIVMYVVCNYCKRPLALEGLLGVTHVAELVVIDPVTQTVQ